MYCLLKNNDSKTISVSLDATFCKKLQKFLFFRNFFQLSFQRPISEEI